MTERTPPGSATAFRRALRRTARRRAAAIGIAVVVAAAALAVLTGPGGHFGAGGAAAPPSGALVLGTPIPATTTCTNGESAPMEAVPWVGADPPLTTANITLELVELIDGDVDGGPTPAPSVTVASVCGAPWVTGWASWYAVLQNPAGANVAYFSYSQGWVDLAAPGQPLPIGNGSTLVLISDPSFANLSFGLCVLGIVGGPSLDVCAQL
jgi:hypothetical protein